MKKVTTKTAKTKTKRTTTARASSPVKTRDIATKRSGNISIYVYWFIILFFIAATFYILGRSQHMLNDIPAQVSEEALMQASDYYESGRTQLIAGDFNAAIADLTASINADESAVNAYILRGEAYMQSGNYDKALEDFNAAIERDANNAVAYYDRSLLSARMEEYSAAMNDINMALSLTATQPNGVLTQRDLYAKRGKLNLWMKNWEGAIGDYTNSLARAEGTITPSVYAERAEAYTATGAYANAVEDYASATRVINEQIRGTTSEAERESLSADAMSYFEKSAALNLQLGNIDAARTDLASAYTLAATLNETESVERLQALIQSLN